jgi:putrescine transport system ATP-binding protein
MSKFVRKGPKLEPWQDMKQQPHIVVENLTKTFDGVTVVKNVNLEIYKGEFFCLLGPSGCGKTTLLRMLAGFEEPSSGKIYINGTEMARVPAYKRPVNMMFQSYALFPHMTVEQNVGFGLVQEGLPKKYIKEKVSESLRLVQMERFANRKPHQLSGGQRQRVALARSLIKQPQLLLLDEPLAALDKKLRERTQFELVNIQESVGVTCIMVTHDQEEAMTMGTRLAIMEEGHVRQVGTAKEIYEFPNSRYVADFIGTMNIFEGLVMEDGADHVTIQSDEIEKEIYITPAAGVPEGSYVTVAIRPEKILLSTSPIKQKFNCTQGIVKDIGYLGDVSIYHVEVSSSGKVIQAMLPNLIRYAGPEITWEDKVYLHWTPENAIVLTA